LLLASVSVAEKNAADQKAAEQKVAEQKVAEQKVAEQKAAEQKVAEQKEARQKEPEEKKPEEKRREKRNFEEREPDWSDPIWSDPIWSQRVSFLEAHAKRSGNGRPEPDRRTVAERIADDELKARMCMEPFERALGDQPSMGRLAPRGVDDARQRLSSVIDEQIKRINKIREELACIAELDADEAPARMAFETGAEGDRQRRYVLSRDRLLNRTVDTFLKVRKNSNDGSLEPVDIHPDDAIDPDDPINVDNKDNADEPPGSGPVQDFGPVDRCDPRDLCNGQTGPVDVVRVDSTTSAVNGPPPAPSQHPQVACDAGCILRNEASLPVSQHGAHRENQEESDISPGDPCVADASSNGPPEPGDIVPGDSTTPDLGGPPLARGYDQEVSCDGDCILRNKANSPVSRHEEHRENEEVVGIGPGEPCVADVSSTGPPEPDDTVPRDSTTSDVDGRPPPS
jgi:hypothetical protein